DDDQLSAVARAPFRHRVADMGTGGGRAEEQLDADLFVAQPLSHQGQYLALALGQHGQPVLRDLGGDAFGGELGDEASGDPRGASNASPAAITRMACSSSAGPASLSRKPLAPACSVSKTYASVSYVVRINTRTCSRPRVLTISLVALIPSNSGMRMSMSEYDVGWPGPAPRPQPRWPPPRRP